MIMRTRQGMKQMAVTHHASELQASVGFVEASRLRRISGSARGIIK
jgi:hypothetical protein